MPIRHTWTVIPPASTDLPSVSASGGDWKQAPAEYFVNIPRSTIRPTDEGFYMYTCNPSWSGTHLSQIPSLGPGMQRDFAYTARVRAISIDTTCKNSHTGA